MELSQKVSIFLSLYLRIDIKSRNALSEIEDEIKYIINIKLSKNEKFLSNKRYAKEIFLFVENNEIKITEKLNNKLFFQISRITQKIDK